MTTPQSTKSAFSIFAFALAFTLLTLLASGAAQAQIALPNVEAEGSDKLKITVKGGPTIEAEEAMTFDIDGANMATIDNTIQIEGTVDDTEKKPILTVTNWAEIELQLEALIDDADPMFGLPTVVIDQEKAKVKMGAKLKTDLDLSIQVSFPFTVNADYAGKFKLKGSATEARPPACADNFYDGVESIKVSAKGAGSLSSKDQVASLELDAENTPFDQMLGFTYTNNSYSPNTELTGSIDYTGKKPVIVFDAGSIADLEENLEVLIFNLEQLVVTVRLGETKTSFKCGKGGDTAQFSYQSDLTIVDGLETLPGKIAIKNKMGLD